MLGGSRELQDAPIWDFLGASKGQGAPGPPKFGIFGVPPEPYLLVDPTRLHRRGSPGAEAVGKKTQIGISVVFGAPR